MLGRRRQFMVQARQLSDALLLAFAFYLTYWIRVGLSTLFPGVVARPFPFENYAWLLLPIMIVWPLILEATGYYRRLSHRPDLRRLGILVRSVILGIASLIFISYLLHVDPPISRLLTVGFGIVGGTVLWGKDWLLWIFESRARKADSMADKILLVGSPERVARLMEEIREQSDWKSWIVGWLSVGPLPDAAREDNGVAAAYLGPLDELADVMHDQAVDVVIFDVDRRELPEVDGAIRSCETEGIEAWLLVDYVRPSIARAGLDEFLGRPTLVFRTTPSISWQLAIKRIVDIAGSLLLLLLTSPVWILTALAIRLTSPGPILFRQIRVGLHGRPFTLYKFRSMVPDAEIRREEVVPYNEMDGPVFKMKDDPRLTPVGRFIRRFSIDELPQLWNVLRGEMSLVGPRPPIPEEVAQYETWQRRRLSMKPGLTCIWQVRGRNRIPFEEWMELDLEYIDNWSLWLDFKILLQTVPVVLTGYGAR